MAGKEGLRWKFLICINEPSKFGAVIDQSKFVPIKRRTNAPTWIPREGIDKLTPQTDEIQLLILKQPPYSIMKAVIPRLVGRRQQAVGFHQLGKGQVRVHELGALRSCPQRGYIDFGCERFLLSLRVHYPAQAGLTGF